MDWRCAAGGHGLRVIGSQREQPACSQFESSARIDGVPEEQAKVR